MADTHKWMYDCDGRQTNKCMFNQLNIADCLAGWDSLWRTLSESSLARTNSKSNCLYCRSSSILIFLISIMHNDNGDCWIDKMFVYLRVLLDCDVVVVFLDRHCRIHFLRGCFWSVCFAFLARCRRVVFPGVYWRNWCFDFMSYFDFSLWTGFVWKGWFWIDCFLWEKVELLLWGWKCGGSVF